MSKVTIAKVELSTKNPNTEVDVDGINGQVNVSEKDGSHYVTIRYEDKTNPIKKKAAVRGYRKNTNGKWPGATPKELAAMAGVEIPGAKFVTANVQPYQIDGNPKPLNTYTTVVMEGENIATIFTNQGHPLMGSDGQVIDANATLADVRSALLTNVE